MENDVTRFENLHKKLTFSGAINIVIGVLSIVGGLVCGVLAIISGAKLLSSRSKLLF